MDRLIFIKNDVNILVSHNTKFSSKIIIEKYMRFVFKDNIYRVKGEGNTKFLLNYQVTKCTYTKINHITKQIGKLFA